MSKQEEGGLNTQPPLWDNIVQLGKANDRKFQALAYMGKATHMLSWTMNALEDEPDTHAVQEEIRAVMTKLHDLQDSLRAMY